LIKSEDLLEWEANIEGSNVEDNECPVLGVHCRIGKKYKALLDN